MPPHFSAMYTPIAAAGTQGQIRHVARLIATQLTSVGLGPGARQAKKLQVIPKVRPNFPVSCYGPYGE
jgi:symplekin